MFMFICQTSGKGKVKKGKAIPLEAWRDPECSRRLRYPDFEAHEGGKVVSPMHWPPLTPPGNVPGTHFC